jgi:hypothetical protein
MELLLALGAFVVVDVLALRYGFDSRPMPVPKNSPTDERRDN